MDRVGYTRVEAGASADDGRDRAGVVRKRQLQVRRWFESETLIPDVREFRRGSRVSEKEHLRHGKRLGMRDGEERRAHAHAIGVSRGAPMQPQLRRSAHADDFDILPQHAARVAGSERLHCRFLGRETPGEMRYGIAPARTIGNLPLGEDPAQKAVAVATEHVGHAGDVGGVEADPEYVHA